MSRILLDECVPIKLKFRIEEQDQKWLVSTVSHEKWNGLKNGHLLVLAAEKFDVFITIDQNMEYQQRLVNQDLAVIALVATSSRYQDLLVFIPLLVDLIKQIEKGRFYRLTIE